jgi:phage terminase large subunit
MSQERLHTLLEKVRNDIGALCALLNYRPTNQQREVLNAVVRAQSGRGKRRIACKSGQGPGKCVVGSTEILNVSSGHRTTVKALAESAATLSVNSLVESTGKITTAEASAFPSGRKKCLRVRARSGTWLDVSRDHPFYTARGWVRAEELRDGDLLAMPRQLHAQAEVARRPDHEIRLAAYFASDGGTSRSQPRFTHMPGVVLDEFLRDVITAGGGYRFVQSHSRAKEVGVSGLNGLIREFGYDKCLSKNKRVPAWLYGLPADQVADFLNRFWSCDGWIDDDGLSTCLASEGIVQDLQTLLLRLGIHSHYRARVAAYKDKDGKRHEFPAWHLNVSGHDEILNFLANVGPILGKEQRCYDLLNRVADRKANTNLDIVPVKSKEMKEILAEMNVHSQRGKKQIVGKTRAQARELCRGRDYAFVSRTKFANFCKVFGYEGKKAWLATSDIYWTPFVGAEDIGEHEVYDLNVPATGNFVAQNLVIHNTRLSGVAALWRVLQYENSLVVVTAPTMKQCKENWLAEFRRLVMGADPIIQQFVEVTNTKIVINQTTNWGIRLETATKPENFQGKHEKHLMYVMDEASGVPREIYEVIKGTVTNKDAIILCIGNPNSRDSAFFDCFTTHRSLWETITLNAEHTPSSEWFDPRRNKELEEEFGRNSDVYRIRVLGDFPLADPNTVIGIEQLEPATDKKKILVAARIPRFTGTRLEAPAKQFGTDFARFGGDESIIMRRAGNAIIEWEFYAKTEPAYVVDRSFVMQHEAGWRDEDAWYVSDAGGMGQGVMHKYYDARKNILEFNSGGRAGDSQFANAITEAWFHVARLARRGELYIPQDNRLIQQLCTRQYFTNKKGKLILEDKDNYKKRGHDSPDRADALVMAFYDQVLATGHVSTGAELAA